MRQIEFSADRLAAALLNLSKSETVCLLDSCGASHLDSRLLIAGIEPRAVYEINDDDAQTTLRFLDRQFSEPDLACVFSVAYDFGLKLENIEPRPKKFSNSSEPDVFLAAFDCLIVHDYATGATRLTGSEKRFDRIERVLRQNETANFDAARRETSAIASNFTRANYVRTIEEIQERIRRGATYQTNLTQQIRARLPETLSAQEIFWRLRRSHPAPFAAFLKRGRDTVVSISPERFFRVASRKSQVSNRTISTSPIKGTRPRGRTPEEDLRLRAELLASAKDRAENAMIVDLLRNDLGRICEFGSVAVEKLCDLETHPTLFHLVSTVRGDLRADVKFSDILRAVFPCGSITGAPKISTMRIIDELETARRGLSMGAIGYAIPDSRFQIANSFDLSVAIRTMTIENQQAVFNVGGGIVIDSTPELEYEETLVKAKALLKALGAEF